MIEYKPMLDHALELASHQPSACVIVQRERLGCALVDGRDLDWAEVMASASPVDPVPVAATDPLYVLYTSGTTGKPKGIVRDNGGHAVALLWSMRHIYDIDPGDVFWAASDVGWVVGHSYIVYGPLLAGAHDRALRGKAHRHTGSRRVLASGGRVRGEGVVHRADGASGRSARRIRRARTSAATTCRR